MGQITNALAERQAAPKEVSRSTVVRHAIEAQAARFGAILPAGFDTDRFTNLVLTAIKAKPQLMECFATDEGKVSVLLSAMQAAAIGLEPDTPMQEAWLLPRRNGGRMECQLSIGYQGYLKLARRSGDIKSITAQVVRQGDEFHYEYGLEDDVLRHVPRSADGELTHAYAVARYKDGGYNFVVLSKAEVEARRAKSDGWRSDKSRQYNPWTTATDSMWRKSAVRELAKWMPKSADLARALSTDDARLSVDADSRVLVTVRDDDDEPLALAAAPDGVDQVTGELISPEVA